MESSEEGEGTYRFGVYKVYTSCGVMENWLAFHCRTKETGVMLHLCDGLVRILYVLCDSRPCSATGDAGMPRSRICSALLQLAVIPCANRLQRLDDLSWRNARKVCIGATAFA